MYEEYEVYNDRGELITEYDLNTGYLTPSVRIEHHDAIEGVEEVYHWKTIREYPSGGKDVEKVIDVPGVEAKDAWDEEIQIYIYHAYTEEELAEIEKEKNKPSQLDVIEAQVFFTAMMTDTLLEV